MFINFEHKLLKILKQELISNESLMVAVSGGADSMALLESLRVLQPVILNQISVAHIHHGSSDDPHQLAFRNECWGFLKKYCTENKIPFYSNIDSIENVDNLIFNTDHEKSFATTFEEKSPDKNKNINNFGLGEESLRDFRYLELNKLMTKHNIQKVLLAHHHEDQLETRLLRLVRGTHKFGLKAMSLNLDNLFRPLMGFSKKEIIKYLKEKNVSFIEDPSNQSSDPLRNWVRNEWLPKLEEKCPGGVNALSRSLENILNEGSEPIDLSQGFLVENNLSIPPYLALSVRQQKEILAQFLRSQKLFKFTQNHISEIHRRIQSFSHPNEFDLLKKRWTLDGAKLRILKP